MLKAYKFRLYPDDVQISKINSFIGSSRFVYNHYLNLKQKKYNENNINYNVFDMKKDLKELYTLYPWLKEIDSCALRTSLDDLDRAYDNFFNKLSGYPNYKKKRISGSYRTNCIRSSYKNNNYSNIKIDLDNRTIKLPKLGIIKIRGYRNMKTFPNKIYNATISREGNKYYVSVCVEEEIILPKFRPNKIIGIDVGIKDLVITSDGIKYKNEKNIERYEKKIKGLQRWLSRAKKESKNSYKIKLKLQSAYRKLRNARNYMLHKISKEIVDNNDIIFAENLKIKNMVKNHHLSKSIIDSSWGELIRQIEYKSKWQNKKFYKINTYYASSQTCSVCGKINKKVKDLSIREWTCEKCGSIHDRDINASINILNEGIREYKMEYCLC